MASAECPSHAWDRYVDELDATEEARRRFIVTHADRIAAVLAGLCANPALVNPAENPAGPDLLGNVAAGDLVAQAVTLVDILHGMGADPSSGEWIEEPVEIREVRELDPCFVPPHLRP